MFYQYDSHWHYLVLSCAQCTLMTISVVSVWHCCLLGITPCAERALWRGHPVLQDHETHFGQHEFPSDMPWSPREAASILFCFLFSSTFGRVLAIFFTVSSAFLNTTESFPRHILARAAASRWRSNRLSHFFQLPSIKCSIFCRLFLAFLRFSLLPPCSFGIPARIESLDAVAWSILLFILRFPFAEIVGAISDFSVTSIPTDLVREKQPMPSYSMRSHHFNNICSLRCMLSLASFHEKSAACKIERSLWYLGRSKAWIESLM